jgi:hypothetical protein
MAARVRGWVGAATAWALVGAACVASAPAQVPAQLSPAEFAALGASLSEPEGYFDTDNLISNEDSYLHAITGLRSHDVRGGAYIGVGPDQNFSYIAAIRPHIAFIVDIRRANLLEQLLFKALFASARNRLDYLCLLLGEPAPADTSGWGAKDVTQLVAYVQHHPADSASAAQAAALVLTAVRSLGFPLAAEDLATIARFHRTFIEQGLNLRMSSFGRPERLDYPTYGDLLRQTDLDGRQASYLAHEADFRFVQSLERRNLIVPVVGDLAGPKAVRAIGRYLGSHHEVVAAFYASNVEQYLFRSGTFDRWAGNVAALPHDQRSVIIRSFFPYGRPHPDARPGYLTVQLLQTFTAFLAGQRAGGYQGYWDLVTRDVLAR